MTATAKANIQNVSRWRYNISWDNPIPANSKTMLAALRRLGRISTLATKTSIALAPISGKGVSDVRAAIKANLNPRNGSAFYVNLRSGRAFQISPVTAMKWISAP